MYLRLTLFMLCTLCLSVVNPLQGQQLVDIEYQGQRTQQQLVSSFGPLIQNGVDLWKVTYETNDVFGQLDTASGLLVVPKLDQPTIAPMLVYQHGTVNGPADVPSELDGGWELAAVFGGLGYVSLAPDYLGLGESRGFHPYVHAESEASAAIDMMRAVRTYAADNDILLNDQVFLTGYSQGGHASMALHRSLELEHSEEFAVTAAAHLSGPYSIGDVMREVIVSDMEYYYPAYLPNTFLSFNYVYGLYDSLEQVFKPAYVPGIESFYNHEISLSGLNAMLISQLVSEVGAPIAKNMLQDSIVVILESEDESHPMRQALLANDVYEWAPQQPTRIFYCMADDQVYFRNSVVADSVMNELGAPDVVAADLNSNFDHGQCVEPAVVQTAIFFTQFATFTVDADEVDRPTVSVFPNPAGEQLQLRGIEEDVQLSLYDLTGRLIYQQRVAAGTTSLSTKSWVPGTYYLILEGNGINLHQKLIKG